MASYFDEHELTDRTSNPEFFLELARLLLSSRDLLEITRAGFGQIQAPPASKEVVECLPTVSINIEHVVKGLTCPVCRVEFKWLVNDLTFDESKYDMLWKVHNCHYHAVQQHSQAGDEIADKAKELPCDHLFHQGCILPWLSKTNSCPLCRHELPTDDSEYEAMRNLKVKEQDQQFRVETLHGSMFS